MSADTVGCAFSQTRNLTLMIAASIIVVTFTITSALIAAIVRSRQW